MNKNDVFHTVNSEILAKGVKRHICDVQTLRLRHDLTISVNDRVVLPFREGLIFKKLKPSRKFPNLQYNESDVAY